MIPGSHEPRDSNSYHYLIIVVIVIALMIVIVIVISDRFQNFGVKHLELPVVSRDVGMIG